MIPPDEVCTTGLGRLFAAMPPMDDTMFNSAANTMRSTQHAVSPPDDFDEVGDLSNAPSVGTASNLTQGNDIGSFQSSLTSVTSSILHGVVGEGQRVYAAYGKEGMCGRNIISNLMFVTGSSKACANTAFLLSEYGLPMDDQELDRMDLCHTKYYALLKQRRFVSPIDDNPQRILDLGCGTGNSARNFGYHLVTC